MNLRVLMVTQFLGAIVMGVISPLLPLLAEHLSGSQTVAGLSQALITCGAMAASLVLALLAVRRGRRAAIAAGTLAAALGLLLIGLGAVAGELVPVLSGCVLAGGGIAAGLQSRFAATDGAARPGRALGILQWASLAGGVAGPVAVPVLDGLIPGLPPMSGAFLVIALLLLVSGVVVLAFLPGSPGQRRRVPVREGLATVLRIPAARRGLVTLATVHAAMVSLMNMAGVHLHHGGAGLGAIGMVISFHVAAMYLPGPLVGHLADRYGPRRLLGLGLSLQLAAAVTLQLGDGPGVVGAGLTLLGLGWSAGFLGGTMLLTEALPERSRTAGQGASDFVVQLSAAAGALGAGTVVSLLGYAGLCAIAGCVLLAVLAWVRVSGRRETAPSAGALRDLAAR